MGVRSQFDNPAMGIYHADIHGKNTLSLVAQHRMDDLPLLIVPGTLSRTLLRIGRVVDTRALHSALGHHQLQLSEQQVVAHIAVAMWCPIVHSQEHLLGLIVLGLRGDFDPYRRDDQQSLQGLVNAAALAFAHSAALAQQREAEEVIRGLYQRVQAIRDATANAIARELHDEIINVHIRLNMESLRMIAARTGDPDLLRELTLILESEQEVIAALRTICERLYPTGLDDPLGLPDVLEMELERLAAAWSGTLQVRVSGHPRPIAAETQREALRIAKEAVANAIKHADACRITVHLHYPMAIEEPLLLTISDNGRANASIELKPQHWGVRGMQESARAVNGDLAFVVQPGVGTEVVFSFPAIKGDAKRSKDGDHGASTSFPLEDVEETVPSLTRSACQDRVVQRVVAGSHTAWAIVARLITTLKTAFVRGRALLLLKRRAD